MGDLIQNKQFYHMTLEKIAQHGLNFLV